MKIYRLNDERKHEDIFTKWFFDLEEARKEAKYLQNHLTEREKADSSMNITGYEISLDSYDRTAEQLITDLFNGDIEYPKEYDPLIGFIDQSIFWEEDI